jgi:hypothetical protein
MSRKMSCLGMAALLLGLLIVPEAQAWGIYHAGYAHLGYGGVYRYGRTGIYAGYRGLPYAYDRYPYGVAGYRYGVSVDPYRSVYGYRYLPSYGGLYVGGYRGLYLR